MNQAAHKTLIIGGARSGKSQHAVELAQKANASPVLIATAQAGDAEMAARIARHKAERPTGWQVVEEPLRLAEALGLWAHPKRIVVVDCATLWLCNLIESGADVAMAREGLIEAARQVCGPVVFVSNEVGLGIVPGTELGRLFRDEQGILNQTLARVCDTVVFMAAGLPLHLKPSQALPAAGVGQSRPSE